MGHKDPNIPKKSPTISKFKCDFRSHLRYRIVTPAVNTHKLSSPGGVGPGQERGLGGAAVRLDVGGVQDDAAGGESGEVRHDDLRVVPGHVGPAQVLHRDHHYVGQAGHLHGPQPQEEEERESGHEGSVSGSWSEL